ncbi:hypothetical protein BD413DRAFT_492113 [Trametes elegans]|nr:hypothetical protein BD413DRAFT_492113 [Trametes elegans]
MADITIRCISTIFPDLDAAMHLCILIPADPSGHVSLLTSAAIAILRTGRDFSDLYQLECQSQSSDRGQIPLSFTFTGPNPRPGASRRETCLSLLLRDLCALLPYAPLADLAVDGEPEWSSAEDWAAVFRQYPTLNSPRVERFGHTDTIGEGLIDASKDGEQEGPAAARALCC